MTAGDSVRGMIVFRPLWGLTVWSLVGLAMLIGLGVWQIERLHWKEDLIARVDTRMHTAPEPLDAALARGLDDAEWRHVVLRGRFENDREVYVFAPGPHGQPGVQVIAPFVTGDGKTILVNRGFVPDAKKEPATRAAGQMGGQTTVTGILRLSSEPSWFTPSPDPRRRVFYSRTAPAMARMAGVVLSAPIFIEADATPNAGGYPVGGQTVVDFPNNHLQYAITWFGLALALVGVYLAYHARQGRLRVGK